MSLVEGSLDGLERRAVLSESEVAALLQLDPQCRVIAVGVDAQPLGEPRCVPGSVYISVDEVEQSPTTAWSEETGPCRLHTHHRLSNLVASLRGATCGPVRCIVYQHVPRSDGRSPPRSGRWQTTQCPWGPQGTHGDAEYRNGTGIDEGPLAAARVAWALRYAGVSAWLLDGGLAAWAMAGHSISNGFAMLRVPNASCDNASGSLLSEFNVSLSASTAEVETVTAASQCDAAGTVLADTRSLDEFEGRHGDYTFFSTLGRIPGSVWAGWGPGTYAGGYFWQEQHDMLLIRPRVADVALAWRQVGIDPNRRIIFYCGSGWRSSLAALIAVEAGYRDVANYDGGWFEWAEQHPAAEKHRELSVRLLQSPPIDEDSALSELASSEELGTQSPPLTSEA